MFRKTILALAAIGSLGAAALAPTSASAWGGGWHGHHGFHGHRGFHRGFYGPRLLIAPAVSYYGGCYWVKRIVPTPAGPRRRAVQICD